MERVPTSLTVPFLLGHAAESFALARVIASEYPSKPVQIAAYAFCLGNWREPRPTGTLKLRNSKHWVSYATTFDRRMSKVT
jgi:hypothetical protein